MQPREHDRGVSEVVGFVLIFSILVISFSLYQGVVVPEQNRQAEFQHNQRVQGELLNLRDAIIRTGTTGVGQSASITVGANYPRRTLAVNFAVTGGSVLTRDPAPNRDTGIRIRNATSTDPETADFINRSEAVIYDTKSIVYRPVYTRYSEAPDTVISGGGGTVFNQFDRTNLSVGRQVVVSDRTITIVIINGTLQKSLSGEGATVSVETTPLSVATNTVTIRNNRSGNPLNITIPTRIDSETAWNDSSLKSEFVENGGHITDIKNGSNRISILLEDGKYNLRMAKVGIGSDSQEPEAEYITHIDTPASYSENASHQITLEVRDKFNNPVSGFEINGSISTTSSTLDQAAGDEDPPGEQGNESLSIVGGNDVTFDRGADNQVSGVSGPNGRVTFEYTAPNVSSTKSKRVNLNFTIRKGKPAAYEQVWVNFTVQDGNDGGGPTGGGEGSFVETNPASPGDIVLESATGNQNNGEVTLTFNNTGSSNKNISKVRIPFHYPDSSGTPRTAEEADFPGNPGTTISIPGPLSDLNDPIELSKGESSITITLTSTSGQGVKSSGDFFILIIEFDDGSKATYFVGPE